MEQRKRKLSVELQPVEGDSFDGGPSVNTRSFTGERVAGGLPARPPPSRRRRRAVPETETDGTRTAVQRTDQDGEKSDDEEMQSNHDEDREEDFMDNFMGNDNIDPGPDHPENTNGEISDHEEEAAADEDDDMRGDGFIDNFIGDDDGERHADAAQPLSDQELSEVEVTRAVESHESILSQHSEADAARKTDAQREALRKKKQERAATVLEERERERQEREREETEREAVRERERRIRRQRQERRFVHDMQMDNEMGGIGGEGAVDEEEVHRFPVEGDLGGGVEERGGDGGGVGGAGLQEVLLPRDEAEGGEGQEDGAHMLDDTQIVEDEGDENLEDEGEEKEEGELDESTITGLERSFHLFDLNDNRAVAARGGDVPEERERRVMGGQGAVGNHLDPARHDRRGLREVQGALAQDERQQEVGDAAVDHGREAGTLNQVLLAQVQLLIDTTIVDRIRYVRPEVRRVLKLLYQQFAGATDPKCVVTRYQIQSIFVITEFISSQDGETLTGDDAPERVKKATICYQGKYTYSVIEMKSRLRAVNSVESGLLLNGRHVRCQFPPLPAELEEEHIVNDFRIHILGTAPQTFLSKLIGEWGGEVEWTRSERDATVGHEDPDMAKKMAVLLSGSVLGGCPVFVNMVPRPDFPDQ